MVTENQLVQNCQVRLANYYLHKLRAADLAYGFGHGHSGYGLDLFDLEWSQIRYWGDWVTANAHADDRIASLCMEYAQTGFDLLILRQDARERLEWLNTGLEVAHRLDDKRAEMVHLYLLGRTCLRIRSMDCAQDYIQQALALARQLGNRLYMGKALIAAGQIAYIMDDYDQAQAANQQALELSVAIGARKELGLALNGLGNIAFSHSNFQQAIEYYDEFLKISEALGQPGQVCLALRNLASATTELEDYSLAAGYIERCIVICKSTGNLHHLSPGLVLLGDIKMGREQFSDAQDHYHQAVEAARQVNQISEVAYALNRLSGALIRTGDPARAVEYLNEALPAANLSGERWLIAYTLINLTEAHRMTREFQQACSTLLEGLEIILTIRNNAFKVSSLLVAALLWHDQGQSEQAARWTGIIGGFLPELAAEETVQYYELCQSLKDRLGLAAYSAARRQGRKLQPDDALQHVVDSLHATTATERAPQ